MDKPAPVGSKVHDLIRRRWSPRSFADSPVDAATLRSLLEAARWAPSSYNEQPWAFIVATQDDAEDFERMLECLVQFNQSWAKDAWVLVLSVARTSFERNGRPNRHGFHDVGLAVSQLTLQATFAGLGVHQMAGIEVDKARRTYGIPDGWEPVAGIAIGAFGDPDSLEDSLRQREHDERQRKPLADFVFSGAWGAASPAVKSG